MVGVPKISPVEGSILSPEGKVGLIENPNCPSSDSVIILDAGVEASEYEM